MSSLRIPESDTNEGWLVSMCERGYGPYSLTQLKSFLEAEQWVFHRGIEDWTRAADVSVLKKILESRAEQQPVWWFQMRGSRERGPYSKLAILRMAKDHVITRDTLVRHQSWTIALPLVETPLAEGIEGIDDFWRQQHTAFTRQEMAAEPAKPRSWKVDPKNVSPWFVVIALIVSAGVFGGISWWTTITAEPRRARENTECIRPSVNLIVLQAGSGETCSIQVTKTTRDGHPLTKDASTLQGGLVPVIDGQPALPGTPRSGAPAHGKLLVPPGAFQGGVCEVILEASPDQGRDVLVLTQPGVDPVLIPISYE